MLNKWIRYFNQNRKKVFKICIIIVSFFLLLQFLNGMVKQEKLQEYENKVIANEMGQNLINQVGNPIENQIEDQIKANQVSESTTVNIANEEAAIKQFISYCNAGKITEAYSMLSEECRAEVFQTEEQFQKNYYAGKFEQKKVSNLFGWINGTYGETYRVRLYENLLETGTNAEYAIEDYITVNKVDKKYVLNINSYIGKKVIDKSSSTYGVTILANKKNIYNDYEEFYLTVTNGTEKTICLDPKETTNSTYLVGGDGSQVNYTAYIHELTEDFLVIKPNETKNFNIKFNKTYTGKETTKSIYFSNAILDYEEYLQTEDKQNYNKKILLYVNF